ncbi:MAG: hypothetical protein NVSMB5_10650 [Candidatus Velthaea sp.]
MRHKSFAQTSAFVSERTQAASVFVDSIGVNIHAGSANTGYNNFPQMFSVLQSLGVKHLRDGIILGQNNLCQQRQQLGAAGFRMTDIANLSMQPADFATWASCAGRQSIEAIEAPNEIDVNHQGLGNWVAAMQQYQQMMYRTMRQSQVQAFANVALIGPAFTSSDAYAAVGDLSKYEDYGNMHDYFSGRNPGTPGWGDDGYGSIDWNLRNARPASNSRPIMATESGWGTTEQGNNGNFIHEWTAAEYATRVYFEHFIAGVPRTFLYELYDEPAGGSYTNYGLIRGDGSDQPHWSFYALQNLTGLLSDTGSARSNVSLSYALSGETDNLHHLLLSKADGSVWMALWQEAQDADPDSNQYSYPAAQAVTLSLQNAPKDGVVYQSLMTIGAPQAQPLDVSKPIDLYIGADVTLVRLSY